MRIETKFLRLRQPVTLGDRIDGWRVCWLGGWDRGRLFYIVMVERVTELVELMLRPELVNYATPWRK